MCEYQNYSHPYNNHYFYHHPTQISSPSSASAYYAADISYYQHRTPTSLQHLMVDPWRTPPLPPDSYQHQHHHHHSYQHQHHHPYQQQHYTESYGISSSRQIRNQAEKQRRDKLNNSVTQIAMLVPACYSSPKKMDKISILRHATHYIRVHCVLQRFKNDKLKGTLPNGDSLCERVLEVINATMIIVTTTGKILFVSSKVEDLLGYQPTDLLGTNLIEITCSEYREELKRKLKPEYDQDIPSTSTNENNTCRSKKRSFFLRLIHRAVSKTDQPQFEDVYIEGHLEYPSSKNTKGELLNNDNIVFVGIMKSCREKNITAHSILEATKDEWISRHLIDGTIVYSDCRISYVSGYMSQEVSGRAAFSFMHSDDVLCVMIALRQMYVNNESYGCSCYRLLSKHGKYIYIRTCGHLEVSDNSTVQSFICINTLVTPEEGERLIAEMKAMVAPLIVQPNEPGTAELAQIKAITDGRPEIDTPTEIEIPQLKVDDPLELKTAIEKLTKEVPQVPLSPKTPVPDQQFEIIVRESKNMPPVVSQSCQLGIYNPPCLKTNPHYYNRPPVITAVPRVKDNAKRTVGNEGGYDREVSVIKRIRPEGVSVISEGECAVIRSIAKEDSSNNSHIITQDQSVQNLCQDIPPTTYHDRNIISSNHFFVLDTPEQLDFQMQDPLESCQDTTSQLVEVEVPIDHGIDLWDSDDGALEKRVVRNHLHLESNIETQERQIFAIEDDLNSVPVTNTGLHSTINHLRAEHLIQKQILKDLQEDHQKIQQCKEQIVEYPSINERK